jgi:hypothetical protein
MSAAVIRGVGVKGSDVYASTGDARVDLNVKLVRGAAEAVVRAGLDEVVVAGHLEDAILMMFHARNVRGGKGERDVAAVMLDHLWHLDEAAVRRVLPLWPRYGSWRDVFALMAPPDAELSSALLDLAAAQLEEDQTVAAADPGKSISLCAKWAPREHGSRDDKILAGRLAGRLFPDVAAHPSRMKAYRKLVAGLNKRLSTVETLMCAGRWSAIRPVAVPGRAGKLYARAFLNLEGKHGETLRHPEDIDRMACREHFKEHFAAAAAGKAKINGAATVFPHEIVKKAVSGRGSLTVDERAQLSGIWRAMVDATAAGGGLGRTVMMSDFSGSMQSAGPAGDTPFWVSMALGILGSQVATGVFRGRLMTFDSRPTWHTFPAWNEDGTGPADLFACLETLRRSRAGQGTSTNFEAAMRLVLDTLRSGRVPPGEEPENLLVLTDMGWDMATGRTGRAWETHVERLRAEFAAGGWRMPTIVIWNLAAQYSGDYHATADVPGVAMLSGWSAAQFRVLQKEVRQLTALEVLRMELDDPMYDPVRTVFRTATDTTVGGAGVEANHALVGAEANHALVGAEANHSNGWGIEADGVL